jgi:hypothetical protein
MWRSDDKETDRVGDSEISQEISSLETVLGTNLRTLPNISTPTLLAHGTHAGHGWTLHLCSATLAHKLALYLIPNQ